MIMTAITLAAGASLNITLAYLDYQLHIEGIDMRPSKQQGVWRWLHSADRLTLKRVYEYAETFSAWRVRLRRDKLGEEKWLDLTLQLFNEGHFLEAEAYAFSSLSQFTSIATSWEAYGHVAVLSQVAAQRGLLEQARVFGEHAMSILQGLAPPYWDGKVALLQLQLLLLVPTVPMQKIASRTDMVLGLQQFTSTVQHTLPLPEFLRTHSITRYLLPYQGLDDRQVNEELNKALVTLIPELEYHSVDGEGEGGRGEGGGGRPDGVTRVGFVSKHLDMHSVGMSLMPLLVGLASRASVELYLYYVTAGVAEEEEEGDQVKDELRRVLRGRFVTLPEEIDAVRHCISRDLLHVLVFPDIGLDSITLALSQARLAPVQAQWWGHPVTSGSPHIDYFLGLDVERAGASDQYTEQLVRFSYPNVSPKIQRSSWRLPVVRGETNMTDQQLESFNKLLETLRLPHLIGRSLDTFAFGAVLGRAFKFSAPFVDVLALLLCSFVEQEEEGRYNEMYIVVISEEVLDRNAVMYTHLARALEAMVHLDSDLVEKALQRLRFLNYNKYFDLLASPVTRVVFDTFPFGGCLSTLDAFSHGLPVVTLDSLSAQLRGLFTTSMLTHMREPALQRILCAPTQAAYVHIALTLLNNNTTVFVEAAEAVERGYVALLGTSAALTDEFMAFLEGVS